MAAFVFRMPFGNGADDVSLGFNSANGNYEIRDTTTQFLLASKIAANNVNEVLVFGNEEVDVLRIAPSFLNMPLQVLFNGDRGDSDKIVTQADTNQTLITNRLTIGECPPIILVGVEAAQLTGGAGNNVIDASEFSVKIGSIFGSVTLDGGVAMII